MNDGAFYCWSLLVVIYDAIRIFMMQFSFVPVLSLMNIEHSVSRVCFRWFDLQNVLGLASFMMSCQPAIMQNGNLRFTIRGSSNNVKWMDAHEPYQNLSSENRICAVQTITTVR